MRRADRLFRLVQRLRRRSRAVTARELAEALGVTERTVYRDVADLVASGVPVRGEAGVGYVLDKAYDLPPLMFDADEVEALAIGARIASAWGDPQLSAAAGDALAKIEAVLPPGLRDRLAATALFAPDFHVPERTRRALRPLRDATRTRRKILFEYRDGESASTRRKVRPLALAYWGRTWTLAGWCELRRDFRNFRLDRLDALEVLDERFEPEPGRTLEEFLARVNAEPSPRRRTPAIDPPAARP